ncbi:MAG: hypothetical protein V3R89_07360, partial [Thermoanaerobaculia bacterium]
CMGCHAAGATGMHFDMTARPDPDRPLVNLSPYGEWRSSPMGLAGRDPIFFAQLETERSRHEELDASIQDLCLHCHGVMGQRQFCMDQPGRGDPLARCSSSGLMDLKLPGEGEAERELFTRAALDADPLGDPEGQHGAARYGALARDGISCAVCHRLQVEDYRAIGKTFTGDFLLGPADRVTGPFEKPQVGHMERSLGVTPVYDPGIRDSAVCASCHTVVLPVLGKGGQLERFEDGSPRFVLEQGTWPEWFFSGYRDGRGGAQKRSCQDCHMPKRYSGQDLSFKIATIQEASNFPETENRRSRAELDLEPRAPYARHTLVGLNVFLNLMAQQFPDVLGLRIMDPMLVGLGRPGLETSYEAMVEQGQQRTVELEIEALAVSGGELAVDLAVRSLVGHRFPSGVGFRRVFIELSVLDATGDLLWRSGATDSAGLLIDSEGRPVDGERMWRPGCEPLQAGDPGAGFQPHHEVIRNSDQVQVYQELTVSPAGQPTTSFLSIASRAKDNRLLPLGFAPSKAVMGAEELGSPRLPLDELLLELEPVLSGEGSTWTETKVIEDADFGAGGDTVRYRIPLAKLSGKPASVRATVYYQATPPFYLQDRFCTTPEGEDTKRLFYMAGRLDLEGTEAEGWKLRLSGVEGTL